MKRWNGTRGLAEAARIAALSAALTILQTYPLAFVLDRAGRLDTPDGQFSIWNVAWVARTLVVDPTRVYDANIYFPHRTTLAFSESNLGAGALAIPAYWLTHNALLAHNVVVLLSFTLTAVFTYYLARYLTRSARSATVAAISFAFCPYVFAHTAHIQLLMDAGLPLSLLAFHRFVDRRTLGRATALGLALVAQALSCAYYGVFAGLTIGFAVLFHAAYRRLWLDVRYWLGVAGAAAISMLCVLPFFLPYRALQQEAGLGRTLADAAIFSADWRAYLASDAVVHRWVLPLLGRWNEVLFPGTLALAFGLAAMWTGLRRSSRSRPRSDEAPQSSVLSSQSSPDAPGSKHQAPPNPQPPIPNPRETTLFYTLLVFLAFWASFGPKAGLYSLFYHTIPVFSFLRAPARFGVLVALGLAVLAAFTVERILRDRSRRTAKPILAGLVLFTILDLSAIPLHVENARPVSPSYRMLAALPRGPVAELPFFHYRWEFPRHALYMFNSTYHWQPLINGYSDHIPRDFRQIAFPLSAFPARESFEILKKRRARYVVFHLRLYDPPSRRQLLDRIAQYEAYLRPLAREDEVWLYEIVGFPPH